ncbi:MAG: Crp/Fnr family transcriptional regulator [FCB group bacterium]|nr:Crp/Fnr family transcriptional regulator [FCB group bacterium]
MNSKDLLRQVFLFDSFTDDQLRLLSSFTSLKKLGKNDLLFSEGESAAAFFHVIEGKLKIFKISPDGQEHTFAIQNTGDIVAEAAIFDKETYPAYCQALTASTLLRIPKNDFIGLVMKHPEVGLKMMHAYAKRLRQFVVMVEELSMHDIKSRLARYLIDNSVENDGKHFCRLNITKKELANVLGTIPESLSRTLRRFKNENILTEKNKNIEICDLKKLKSFI